MNEQELALPDGSVTLETSRGKIKAFPLMMDAMEGWEVKRQLRFYRESEDDEKGAALRKKFTLRVLANVGIVEGDKAIELKDAATVNTVLESWTNINILFNAILDCNGIDPEMQEEIDEQAMKIGAAMGQGFWAQCVNMMQPVIDAYAATNGEEVK
jgi:hypothetical protein